MPMLFDLKEITRIRMCSHRVAATVTAARGTRFAVSLPHTGRCRAGLILKLSPDTMYHSRANRQSRLHQAVISTVRSPCFGP